jgi:signal transduction histidine kinase
MELAHRFEALAGRQVGARPQTPLIGAPLALVRRLGWLLAVLVGEVTTVLVVTNPDFRLAHQRPALHAQIATAAALVALLVSILAVGRYRRRPVAGDLLLSVSLAVLGASNLLSTVIPATTGRLPGGFATWMPASGRLLAAALLAGAAFNSTRLLQRPAHAARVLVAGTAGGLAVLATALIVFDPAPPGAVGPAYEVLAGNAASIALKAASVALIAIAAAGFTLRGRRRPDSFTVLLGWGTTLLAFAWLNYLLVPSVYVDWFYAGDALGLLAYLLLALGAVAEIRAYQRDRTRLAAVEERGRLARELHDGVAQELVHVLTQARRQYVQRPGPETEQLVDAAERALRESRAAISTLRAPLDEPLHFALKRTAGELGRRLDLDVRVDAQATDVAPPVREAVMRIVGEALTNAARHGRAHHAAIVLRGGAHASVTVRDDGCGFDPDPQRIPGGSYGLVSMRERAESFGGRLAIRSAPGDGTEVEVALP